MYEDDGKKYYSIVMIEPDEELTAELADFFKNLPSIKFIAMRNLAGGLAMTDCRKADLIITELEFTGLDNVKDQLANQGWAVQGLKDICPQAKIIIWSSCDDEKLIHKYLTKFGVDAYLQKGKIDSRGLLKKVYELLGPSAFSVFDVGPYLFS